MIYAIISTILDSMASVFWKRALVYNAPKEIFSILAYSSIILISTILFITWKLSVEIVSIWTLLIILLITILTYIRTLIMQTVYRNDKISKILPYQNISKIITLIVGFFLFWDTSIITLIIALVTIFIIILFSIDFKKIYIPKTIKLFSIAEVIYATILLLLWYLLLSITNISYFVYSYLFWITFTLILIGYKKQFHYFKELPKQFYGYRLTACHLWWTGYILSLFIMKELWLTVSILVSYIWLASTLVFSYLMFKDKPTKKDLLLIIIVTILISIWYYFK